MKIKIFGERNTSTNALTRLIRFNSGSELLPGVANDLRPGYQGRIGRLDRLGCPVRIQEYLLDRVFHDQPPSRSWKHTATLFDDVADFEGVHVVFCLRHPASWLLGLYNHPYHLHGRRPATLADFLDMPWHTVRRERLDRRSFPLIRLFNEKARSYLRLIGQLEVAGIGHTVIDHRAFAVDQEAVFDRLRPVLDDPRPDFQPLSSSTKERSKTAAYYADYYGRDLWRDEIDAESRRRIAREVDWETFARFGHPEP